MSKKTPKRKSVQIPIALYEALRDHCEDAGKSTGNPLQSAWNKFADEKRRNAAANAAARFKL